MSCQEICFQVVCVLVGPRGSVNEMLETFQKNGLRIEWLYSISIRVGYSFAAETHLSFFPPGLSYVIAIQL